MLKSGHRILMKEKVRKRTAQTEVHERYSDLFDTCRLRI